MTAVKLILLALCILALLRGGGPERAGAGLMIGGYLGQRLIELAGYPYTFEEPDLVHCAFAGVLFLASLVLAIRSNRVWPLFFSALFLVRLTGDLSVLVLQEGRFWAYWIMTQIPVLAQCAVLATATYTYQQRQRRGIRAADWRMKAYP